ncbi:hypothetical protein P691DRAFT_786527 [Macrolepiota fuliginosa MF-IS2]|uniref:DUF6533 domain-containing protein n=1 Tax=Macrolepiota fuliginosa MF-IS2 TaxID=1400762 RepID=A0A9P5X731_9AGAR|nr:hypothetical protein P691DRAFT_786527 [Macrolepiota fuliginosa MF-IS2]
MAQAQIRVFANRQPYLGHCSVSHGFRKYVASLTIASKSLRELSIGGQLYYRKVPAWTPLCRELVLIRLQAPWELVATIIALGTITEGLIDTIVWSAIEHDDISQGLSQLCSTAVKCGSLYLTFKFRVLHINIPAAFNPGTLQELIGYVAVAVSLLFYDVLLGLDTEVELVWRKQWSLSKVLYLICRYLFMAVILMILCGASFRLEFLLYLTARSKPPISVNTSFNPPDKLAPILATTIPDAMILIRLDALYRGETMNVILNPHHLRIEAMEPQFVLSRTPPGSAVQTGCKLYVNFSSLELNIAAWLIPVLAQGNPPIFNGLSNDIHAKYLLRDGAIYFFVITAPELEMWVPGLIAITTFIPLLASRLYLNMRARGLPENNGNSIRMLAFEEQLIFAISESPSLHQVGVPPTCEVTTD